MRVEGIAHRYPHAHYYYSTCSSADGRLLMICSVSTRFQQKSVSDMDFETDQKPARPQYYFQVTSIPESEAPLEHRVAFVGKVFPLMPRNMDGPEPMTGCGVESGLL